MRRKPKADGTLLHTLPCRLLHANPLVAIVDGFLDEAACKDLIALTEGRLERALVLSDEEGSGISDGRTNSDCVLKPAEVPEIMPLLDRLATALALPVSHAENLTVLHYATAEEFQLHADGIWSGLDARAIEGFEVEGGQRLFTTMIYLNAVEEGGGTTFPKLGIRVDPAPGRLLIFANTPAGDRDQSQLAAHAGEPVTGGEKWVAVTWWRERPYTPTP